MATYVRWVEAFNYRVGRFAMYLIFVMIAVLLWSSFTKTMPNMRPSLWTLETAQFLMVAYYMFGGPYSVQLESNVRMDLIYGNLSFRRKAFVDCFTVFFLIVYLFFLLFGGLNSFAYSLGNFTQDAPSFLAGLVGSFFTGGPDAAAEKIGVLERSRSVWRPPLWPVKLVMITGILLMLMQSVAELFKDIERYLTPETDGKAA
ncbi:MAG: TRAP transporter small permease subunit [Oricola sp.]|nr:TRAP transporter small permease subunit [Oricola sp.]